MMNSDATVSTIPPSLLFSGFATVDVWCKADSNSIAKWPVKLIFSNSWTLCQPNLNSNSLAKHNTHFCNEERGYAK
jgi:hypothetical protein